MLRSFFSVVATLVVIISSIGATMGLSGWAGMFLSTATVNVPTLVLTLAVAGVFTWLWPWDKQCNGMEKAQAIQYSIKLNAMPILVLLSPPRLASWWWTCPDSPVLRDFGNLSALDVMSRVSSLWPCFCAVKALASEDFASQLIYPRKEKGPQA